MTTAHARWWIVRALALLLAASAASAQDRVPFRQEELDQMLAPVALYPDSLLSQMLMASTYPLEVVQAARWSRANPGVTGRSAVDAVEGRDWDPSVKSLVAFPRVLAMMNERLDWTEQLGEAFLAQPGDMMDAIQALRRRADAAGSLGDPEQARIVRQPEAILIEPPAPGVVYVPYYDPWVVYGPWWWPAYPPVHWGAPAPYYAAFAPRPLVAWGGGIVIASGFFFGHFDWPHRHVKVVHVHRVRSQAHPVGVHSTWRHDPAHRRGVPYRRASVSPRHGGTATARPGNPAARPPAGTDIRRRTADLRQRQLDDRRLRAAPGRAPDGEHAAPANPARRPALEARPGPRAALAQRARTEPRRAAALPEPRRPTAARQPAAQRALAPRPQAARRPVQAVRERALVPRAAAARPVPERAARARGTPEPRRANSNARARTAERRS